MNRHATKFIMVAAVTMDGKIARAKGGGSSWTSREDKDFLHNELDKCDLIVVGNTTYKLAKKPLAKRKCLVFTHSVRGVLYVNRNLSYFNPKNSPLPRTSPGLAATLSSSGEGNKEQTFASPRGEGKEKNKFLPLEGPLRPRNEARGGKEGVKRVCILGGSSVYSWFLRRNLIDEIFLTIEPLVFGAGVPLFDIPLKVPQTFKLASIKRLNRAGTIILHYEKLTGTKAL